MSQPHYGWNMDRLSQSAVPGNRGRDRPLVGNVPQPPLPPPRPAYDRIREGSPQGHLSPPPRRHNMTPLQPPPNMPPSQPPPPLPVGLPSRPSPRPRFPPGVDGKNGSKISRPTQSPHWPLPPGSPITLLNPEHYRPPPGRPLLAPPRPQRPSRIPSMVDQSRPQQPTPMFLNPRTPMDEEGESPPDYNLSTLSPQGYAVHTPSTPSSRLTTSSVGTIPEFPVPSMTASMPPIPPRRSINLVPPPSSRRHASSLYSISPYVSPIPEENARVRGSYASSAAMPRMWGPGPPQAASPTHSDVLYEDSLTEKSRDSLGDEFGDESNLVRSASIGKKGRAALVENKPSTIVVPPPLRPNPTLAQKAFDSGAGYVEETTSSSDITAQLKKSIVTSKETRATQQFFVPDVMLAAQAETSSWEEIPMTRQSPSPQRIQSEMLFLPPKFDADSVRSAEARGSITSLPDLIKRATRLASMIERGKRPASRFDNLSDLFEKSDSQDKRDVTANDRHQSGFSDMLNAFPPPAHPPLNGRQSRSSWFNTSYPLNPGRGGPQEQDPRSRAARTGANARSGRRCCGMPPWAFILVFILLLCIIAVAVIIPLQFFVFKTLGSSSSASKSSLEQCQLDLVCQNGGTNVISQGTCSCICTNGFTGRDCSVQGSEGCTTTNLVSADSASSIENVTLGRAIPRLIADANANFSIPLSGTAVLAKINSGDLSCRAQNSLVTFDGRATRMGEATSRILSLEADNAPASKRVRQLQQGAGSLDTESRNQPTPTSLPDGSLTKGQPIFPFIVTEEVMDFARVAVLYILQEKNSEDAETAQTSLQLFFSTASRSEPKALDVVTEQEAQNVPIGGSNIINLINFQVDVGAGPVGSRLFKRSFFTTSFDKSSGTQVARNWPRKYDKSFVKKYDDRS